MRKIGMMLLILLLVCLGAAGEETTPPPVRPAREVAPGDTLTLSVLLTLDDLGGLQGELRFDPLCFEPTGDCAFDDAFRSGAMIAMINPVSEGGFSFVYVRMERMICADTVALTLPLRVREDAPLGETAISLQNVKVSGADAQLTEVQTEGLTFAVADSFAVIPDAAESPVPEDTPAPGSRVWLMAEPAAVPESHDATVPPEATAAPAATPTPTPAPRTDDRPQGVITDGDAVTTPAPTAPVLVIGGETEAPASADDDPFALRLTRAGDEVLVALTAENWQAGGLQAEIAFDSDVASYRTGSAAFSREMTASAMLCMVNDAEAGLLRLVYSSVSGMTPTEPIFTARFSLPKDREAVFSLRNVKYTDGGDTNLTSRTMADGQFVIQPMDDIEIMDGESAPEVTLRPGVDASVALNPGERRRLIREGVLQADAVWFSEGNDIAQVTQDGILTAMRAGCVSVFCACDGVTEEYSVCVRDALNGQTLEIAETTVSVDGSALWGVSMGDAEAAKRGIRLVLERKGGQDGVARIEVLALVGEDTRELSAEMFSGCADLVEVAIIGSDILAIRDGAFRNCPDLERVLVRETLTRIEDGAIPSYAELIPVK